MVDSPERNGDQQASPATSEHWQNQILEATWSPSLAKSPSNNIRKAADQPIYLNLGDCAALFDKLYGYNLLAQSPEVQRTKCMQLNLYANGRSPH